MNFHGKAARLTPGDIEIIAGYLGCEIAALQAVIKVESNGKGFHASGRPIILNEPHIFYRQLGPGSKRNEAVKQGLAYKNWRTKPYPRTQDLRYKWLEKAMKIDEAAALKSCSWGMGQIMGFNHKICGFDTVQEFVEAMKFTEGAQVYAIARFIVSNNLQGALKRKDWARFARGYNGSGYAKNGYHTKMAKAYAARPKAEKTIPAIPSDQLLKSVYTNMDVPLPRKETKKLKPQMPKPIDEVLVSEPIDDDPVLPIPKEAVEQALREDGSRTITNADWIKKISNIETLAVALTGLGGAAGKLLDQINDNTLLMVGAGVAVGVLGTKFMTKKAAEKVIHARVDDAITGKHIGRKTAMKEAMENGHAS